MYTVTIVTEQNLLAVLVESTDGERIDGFFLHDAGEKVPARRIAYRNIASFLGSREDFRKKFDGPKPILRWAQNLRGILLLSEANKKGDPEEVSDLAHNIVSAKDGIAGATTEARASEWEAKRIDGQSSH